MSFLLEFECCLQPRVQSLFNHVKDKQMENYYLDYISLTLTEKLVEYLQKLNQPLQIDTKINFEPQEKQEIQNLFESNIKSDPDNEDNGGNCDKSFVPDLSVNECFKMITLSKIVKPKNLKQVPSTSLTSEVENILQQNEGIQISNLLSQPIYSTNASSVANKFIDKLQKSKKDTEVIRINKLTEFKFYFYTTIGSSLSDTDSLKVNNLSEKLRTTTVDGSPKDSTSSRKRLIDVPELTCYKQSNYLSQIILDLNLLGYVKLTLLPSEELINDWENIILGAKFKTSILKCCKNSLVLHNYNLNTNNFIIFEGKPGTGKTSLAKAIFQKLSVLDQSIHEINPGIFLELSTGEIFSKYFGESPRKLSSILSLIEQILKKNPNTKIYLLVDELETIAANRSNIIKNNEVTDGIRIVNILITYLDRLRKYSNLLIVATTNLIDNLDPAIVDRATRSFRFESPNALEIKRILQLNLSKINVVEDQSNEVDVDSALLKIADFCFLSSRYISRLPIIAFGNLCDDIDSYDQIYTRNIITEIAKLCQELAKTI
ncbi:hypothetical protein KGF54_001425 [Candida jiufengensis]|uniref:uncharacterized protein n=1 Tax=Candida jiufengensis TaxID=497108 RepID=UPI002225604E|nr:uncharacterized protein KGF54_001425 [Candida jiufengensis]KAI5955923.1 hypothetical protein KGF54_001425 [Candida jiufengensis]